MAITGRRRHAAVRPRRLQGTTADGTLYRSAVGTFRIDRAPNPGASTERGENLALGATVVALSSEFSADFAGDRAIDGDTTTEWATSGDGDDGFITIDLGAERDVHSVTFATRSMADGSSVTETFTVTVDGARLGPFRAGTVAQPREAVIDSNGRELRFDVATSTGGNVGAVEIGVYGPPP
jgi:hypothetical protein